VYKETQYHKLCPIVILSSIKKFSHNYKVHPTDCVLFGGKFGPLDDQMKSSATHHTKDFGEKNA
jgi:hypothetical protein